MKLLFRTHRFRQSVLTIWVLSLALAVPHFFTQQAMAQQGPALVELLEYLAPRDGRPFPSDEQASDVVHRQTVLLTRGADAAARQLHSGKVNFVSSGVVANQTGQLGFSKALLVRDPDGHAVEIEEK